MFEMDNQQVSMFKEWFLDTYPECKDYLDLTYFDVEKNTFLSKCSYNPDSGNAAKVLRIAFGSWQHQQTKVEELQKRVQFLEQELGAWKRKSITAMVNGMCEQCGKEPWQAIVSDKEGYALLHCFGCGANKYELIGKQALKGEG